MLLVQVEVFWVMSPCSVAVVYQRFGGSYCLTLHTEAAWRQLGPPSSWWRWRQQGPSKHRYPTATERGVTTQRTSAWIFATLETPNVGCFWFCFARMMCDVFGDTFNTILRIC